MANHLALEQSPYLLQHVDNPVDWYPWGDAAFEKARREDKPVFLSIGYATCHWCHVMAHESFENHAVAEALNDSFVAIKVDREERPDVDQIYMTVCQAMTGRGGWPLNVFLTPEGKPFYAGTYFPREERMGMPGFTNILTHIARLWRFDRGKLLQVGEDISRTLQPNPEAAKHRQTLDVNTLKQAVEQLSRAFDPRWGGFGDAPKFPTPHHLTFLLRWYRRTQDEAALNMVERTLVEMRKGGMFDHVGYGFSRYSVDERWLVPHFEKMLYDQALLAMAYLEACQITGKPFYGEAAREIFTYVLRDMTAPSGGFYSAEDADSEGREGWFYVWTPDEVSQILGPELGNLFCRFYDVSPAGNFEHGKSIAHISTPLVAFAAQHGMEVDALRGQMEGARQQLFLARKQRIHPFKDDKILASWNGLMIGALAKGHQVLGEPAYADAARRAADFILDTLRDSSGRLLRRYRNGHVAYRAYLDDYAFLVWGLLDLYETVFEVRYLREAVRLNREMLDLFWDEVGGGCFFSPHDGEELIVRDKDLYDGAVPSGNSVAGLNLLRLSHLTGELPLEQKAEQLLDAFSGMVGDYPMAYTQFLNALDFAIGPVQEIVIVGDLGDSTTQDMLRSVHQTFLPNRSLLFKPAGTAGDQLTTLCGYARMLQPVDQITTAYICEDYACQNPITDVGEFQKTLKGASSGP
ncbi:MAG TPA: thioredoxin domain-containing protein [Syntrophobacteraceae bacterium]|nr:thioredoxin domain-containing protein [Syntrophobacteraceae bacterium]